MIFEMKIEHEGDVYAVSIDADDWCRDPQQLDVRLDAMLHLIKRKMKDLTANRGVRRVGTALEYAAACAAKESVIFDPSVRLRIKQ